MTQTLTPQRCPSKPEPPRCPAPRKVTVADVLERAAYGFEEGLYDWCQGSMYGKGKENARCMVGALWGAANAANMEFGSLYDDLSVPLEAVGFNCHLARHGIPGTVSWDLPEWNDTPGRTKTEVISALRAAASSARTKEEA